MVAKELNIPARNKTKVKCFLTMAAQVMAASDNHGGDAGYCWDTAINLAEFANVPRGSIYTSLSKWED